MDYVDHYAGAKANLAQQYQGKAVMDALIKAAAQEFNELDQAFVDLIEKRPLDVTTGAQLDGWGAILNTARAGLGDADYRTLLLIVLAGYNSTGTSEELISLVGQLMPTVQPIELLEEFPAAVVLQVTEPSSIISQNGIREILQRSKPAGVKMQVVVIPPNPYFGFDEDTDPDAAGFDDGNWADAF